MMGFGDPSFPSTLGTCKTADSELAKRMKEMLEAVS
jgi:hypothetical protein